MRIAHLLIFVTTLALFVPAFAGVPFVHSEGTLTMSFTDVSPEITLQTDLELGWREEGWMIGGTATMTGEKWTKLQWEGEAALGSAKLSSLVVFDPQSASFTSARIQGDFPWNDLKVSAMGLVEKTGAGVGMAVAGPSGAVMQDINLRFNLKRYQDEIIDPTFCPEFSSAQIALSLPIACEKSVQAQVDFDRTGLAEVQLQLQPPLDIFPWLSLGTTVTFRPDEKDVSLSPSLSLESPACFDLYWGIDWNGTTNTLNGLKLYGMGFHAQVGDVDIRSLTSFAPDEIALVKSPYWELFGISRKLTTCCGDGELGIACYFGTTGLFSISEIDVELTFPIFGNGTLSFSWNIATGNVPTIAIGWDIGF